MRLLRITEAKQEVIVRFIADAVLINVALVAALVVRYLNVTTFEHANSQPFWQYTRVYRDSIWAFTPLALAVLYAHGIYTYGRSYRRRAKILLILRAVTIAYLVFGFGSYFLAGALYIPRGVLTLGWLLTAILLIGARLWTWLWLVAAGYSAQRLNSPIEDRHVVRVLVIGGAGYIGSEVVRLLVQRGYAVRVLDLLLYGIEPLKSLTNHARVEIVPADFRKVDKVVEALHGVDAVIHLGAIVGDPACALDEDLTIQVNLTATRMIAEVAKGNGVNRFIFASTCSVYGASDQILDEQSALNPVSLYARSKIASEQVLLSMADDRFAPVVLRFGTVFGLSGRTRFDLVVNLMTARAMFEHSIEVLGGEQWRPFVHVADAARAVVECLEAPLAVVRQKAFNVGSDEQNYTIKQVAQLVAASAPGTAIVDETNVRDRRNYRVSFKAIQTAIGFVPKWSLEQGIQQVIEAIRRGDVVDYRDPKYSNVRFLSEEGLLKLGRQELDWEQRLIRATPGLADQLRLERASKLVSS